VPIVDIDAVVVRVLEYAERDKILSLLCPTRGRVDVIARGARASFKRFGGHIELLNCVNAQVELRSRGTLFSLQSATATRQWGRLRGSLLASTVGTYAAELALSAASPNAADAPAHGWLLAALSTCDELAPLAEVPWDFVVLRIEREFLAVHGWLGNLSACAVCGDAAEVAASPLGVSVPHLELCCARCRAARGTVHPVASAWPNAPDSAAVESWRKAISIGIAHHLDAPIRSAAVLNGLLAQFAGESP
jgi:DNA repair protein RecO (recombination protein O)